MTKPDEPPWDVLIVGAGNAGMSAAIAASQQGASVLVVEAAAREDWGGNSALTMNFRFPHSGLEELRPFIDDRNRSKREDEHVAAYYQPYPPADFLSDLHRISGGRCNAALARSLACGAAEDARWLLSLGHRWIYKAARHTVPGSMPITIDGGGGALQERHHRIATRLGIEIRFGTILEDIRRLQDGTFDISVTCDRNEGGLQARCIVLACGGFEGNEEMRARHLGELWRRVSLRGIAGNRGDGLRIALSLGAGRAGDWQGCHATPQNADLPPAMGARAAAQSQANSRYLFNVGISVNKLGLRFSDEGEDYPNMVYAKMGGAILRQPEGLAFQLFDHATIGIAPKGYFDAGNMVAAETIEPLALHFSIPPDTLRATVEAFNAVAHDHVIYDRRDRRATSGLAIPKSNWALRLATPPYYMVPVRTGITFTYGGLRVDPRGQVLRDDGTPLENLFCCGEMAGGLFYGNYVGGTGLMFGTHLGRRAGTAAACAASGANNNQAMR